MKLLILSLALFLTSFTTPAPHPSIYELRIYRVANTAEEKRIDSYLQGAFLPAMHRQGIHSIGVFKPVAEDTAHQNLVIVLVPFENFLHMEKVEHGLSEDQKFMADGADYINTAYDNPTYSRFEKILLRAFPMAPQLTLPKLKGNKSERVYELRSYESPSEKLHLNKVKMFNEGGEVDLFARLNFNAVFYGQVIAGSHMPNLMYMTTFENKADRDAHWKSFGEAPEWKKLIAMDEYKNNVSHIDIYFLHPTEYSDF